MSAKTKRSGKLGVSSRAIRKAKAKAKGFPRYTTDPVNGMGGFKLRGPKKKDGSGGQR